MALLEMRKLEKRTLRRVIKMSILAEKVSTDGLTIETLFTDPAIRSLGKIGRIP